MADGDEVSGRSDKCRPCFRKGRDNAGVKFCDTCQTSFCSDCLRQHDDLFDHLQMQDAENIGGNTETEDSSELCGDHKMPITLYCSEENKFGCRTCMDVEHNSCKQVIFLPVSAKALLQDIDVNHLDEMLANTIKDLKAIKLKQHRQMPSLNEDRDKCLKTVNDYHTGLLEKFNAVFRNTTDAITQQFETMRAEIENNIEHVEKSLAELNISRSRVQQFQDKYVPKFVEVKLCQEYIKKAEKVSTEAADNLKIEGLDVTFDSRLENLLTDLESFAAVVKRAPIQVKKKHTVDVSVEDDTQPCDIASACVLKDGSLLLVDFNNKRAKRFAYETLKICDMFSLENRPIGVCSIDDNQILFTNDNRQVMFLSLNPKMSMIREFNLQHRCGYIAYSKCELFITGLQQTLYVYDMECSLLREIVTYPSGANLFSVARHVVVKDTGDLVFVADWENGLLVLDRSGMVVDKVNNSKLKGTRGVYLDGTGGALFCGHTANKVVHVNQERNAITDVLTEADGLAHPKCVCFNEKQRKMFVCQEGSREMIVCEFL